MNKLKGSSPKKRKPSAMKKMSNIFFDDKKDDGTLESENSFD